MKDQAQVNDVLNRFREAATTVEKSAKDTTELKKIQVEFCYAENEIETGPGWNIPIQIAKIEALIQEVKKL